MSSATTRRSKKGFRKLNEFIDTVGGNFRWIDAIDIAAVSYVVYRILLLIKGTRAVQMLTGLGILGLAFLASIRFEFFTLHWLLSYFFDALILIVIVLFQDDLRRALTHVGKNPFFATTTAEEEQEVLDEIVKAATMLSQNRIGALIVIERETGLRTFIDTGMKVDAQVRAELLHSIFIPTSPIHDGAAIVSNGRIAAAGCFLPLTKNLNLDKKFGTRHRAALGLAEETDAVIILVSEETGKMHLVQTSKFNEDLSEEELKNSLALIGGNWRASIQRPLEASNHV